MRYLVLTAALLAAAALPAAAMDNLVPIMPDDLPGMVPDALDGLAGEEGAPQAQEQPTVLVFLDSDIIYLKDGSILTGTVILEAARSTIILTEDGEQMIPSEDIEKIERGRDKDKPVRLPVKKSDGFQFIVMEPIEESEQPEVVRAPAEEQPAAGEREGAPAEKRKSKTKDVPGTTLEKLKPDEIQKLKQKNDKKLNELLEKIKKERGEKPDAPPPPMFQW